VISLKVVAAWAAFALFHSLTVSERYERWARGVLGDGRFQAYQRRVPRFLPLPRRGEP